MAAAALVVAVLGAPRTGRSTLAAALARRAHEETGLRCCCVDAPQRIAAAAAAHDVVVCDCPAPVESAAWHRQHVALSLLTALDPAALSDPLRDAADSGLRAWLQAQRLPWVLVPGQGPARVEAALDAVAPLLRRRATPRGGLLTRLAQRNAAAPQWQWVCEKCDAPECEHRLRARPAPASRPPP